MIGHVNGAHAAISHFLENGRGVLINMISLGGWVPAPLASAYSASKFGLRGFSEALRGELRDRPNVHVCEVYLIFVDSPPPVAAAATLSHGCSAARCVH